jgi:Ca2+-binding EF-hand superfamily protein
MLWQPVQAHIDQILEEVDKDKDGRIDYEVRSFVAQHRPWFALM